MYVIIMSRTSFRVNLYFIVCLNVKELLARSRCHVWTLSDSIGIRTYKLLVFKQTLNHLAKLAKWWAVLWVLICTVHLTVYYYLVTYKFHSGFILYSFPECQGTPCSKQAPYLTFEWQQWDRTHNHLVLKRTLNHLVKLAKWLICVVSTYLYGDFDCMLQRMLVN